MNLPVPRRPDYWVLYVGFLTLLTSCSAGSSTTATGGAVSGAVTRIGAATVTTYAEFDASNAPTAIGLRYSANFFDELPTGTSDQHNCFDRNGDGTTAMPDECNMWYEYVVPLPSAVASRDDIPFKWALVNWNPVGHIPPGVYDVPHFDMHFYIAPIEDVFSIEPGPCGPEFVRCDQFAIATRPVPPNYVAPDYQDVQAVAPSMGNHLIDVTGPEFQGEPFTRSWIYGVYDGAVTYYEEMVTREFLLSHPNRCFPIKTTPEVAVAGYYPSTSCLRFDEATGDYTVSMEGFSRRDASPPAAGNQSM